MDSDPLKISLARETRRVTRFIQRVVSSSRSNGAVLGLSGGVDSAVTGALCVRALGKKSVVVALMNSRHTPMADVEDAEALAKSWGVRVVRAEISKIVDSFEDGLGSEGGRIASANLQARVRMTILYYHANSMGLLVAGTGDRSEEEIGFFTKFGDGGADFLPIAHLFKTQVKALGTYLGIPRKIVEKPPSPQLWTGHTAREELPADYPVIDRVLSAILDQGLSPAKAASATGAPREVVDQILKMRAASDHKRSLPPSLVPKPDVRLIATKD